MKTLHISVSNKVAEYRERDGFIVCGNSNYQVEFAFDSEWDEHEEKTARFVWNNQYFDQEFTGNVCPCPIIKNATEVSVGVYAGNLETTTGANIPCRPSILCGETTAHPETGQNYTNEAKAAAEEAKAVAADLTGASGRVAVVEVEVSKLDKRVTNLEKGITPDPFVTDDSVAYQKSVPVGALPYAALERVGGMSHKCRNLFNGEMIRGYYEANGTLTMSNAAWLSDFIFIGGRTVTFSAKITKGGDALRITAFDANKNFIERSLSGSKDESWTYSNPNAMYVRICVFNGTYDQTTMQLEYGDTATEYDPYYEGIRHTAAKALEIEGANLAKTQNGTYAIGSGEQVKGQYADGSVKFIFNNFKGELSSLLTMDYTRSVLNAGTYTIRAEIDKSLSGWSFMISLRNIDKGTNYSSFEFSKGSSWEYTFTLAEQTTIAWGFYIYNPTAAITDEYTANVMLVEGSTALPFTPYRKDTFVPPVIDEQGGECVEGWGLGISEDCYNYYDFEGNRYVQECGLRGYIEGDETNPEVITDGIETVYPLDEPVVTDFPPMDNFIRVEVGGRITFVNEPEMAAPSTIIYNVEEGTA